MQQETFVPQNAEFDVERMYFIDLLWPVDMTAYLLLQVVLKCVLLDPTWRVGNFLRITRPERVGY